MQLAKLRHVKPRSQSAAAGALRAARPWQTDGERGASKRSEMCVRRCHEAVTESCAVSHRLPPRVRSLERAAGEPRRRSVFIRHQQRRLESRPASLCCNFPAEASSRGNGFFFPPDGRLSFFTKILFLSCATFTQNY